MRFRSLLLAVLVAAPLATPLAAPLAAQKKPSLPAALSAIKRDEITRDLEAMAGDAMRTAITETLGEEALRYVPRS